MEANRIVESDGLGDLANAIKSRKLAAYVASPMRQKAKHQGQSKRIPWEAMSVYAASKQIVAYYRRRDPRLFSPYGAEIRYVPTLPADSSN